MPALETAPPPSAGVARAGPAVKILLVDDQPANLMALGATLDGMGLDLVKAGSGPEALRHLLRGDFALILLDVKMPGMDGLETAELVRQRQRSQHTPIIFLTAYERDDVQMFKGYSLGAVDYLTKPIIPQVLRSKVAVFVEMYRKTEEVKRQAEMLRLIEKRELERQLAEAKERFEVDRLREEIRIARQVQQRLFPAAALPLPGFDLSGASYPAEATGGDYFDYIPLPDGCLAVVVADVSGHGFGPALLMAETRAYLRAFLATHTDIAAIVGLLNRALADDSPERFATMLLGRLDPRRRSFSYVSAGHPTGYILAPSGEVRAKLPSTALPLAVLPEGEFPAGPEQVLAPGEIVLLLTDGIVEAHAPDEELFGSERALAVVRANAGRPAREIVDALYAEVRRFCGERSPLDDMTAVVIKAAEA
ncbi:MAG TPA: SpoIIE family protein phosphatase [Gemmataceae bacterium]|jgi:serine phosphatase RsbU (regulator of sigma subunit)|nr:SpoIIE family protein phosphatase [Gemmataceae bacterium]